MAMKQVNVCSSCTYYAPYPGWDNVGTCDHTLSRHYGRMTIGTDEPCEYFTLAPVSISIQSTNANAGAGHRNTS